MHTALHNLTTVLQFDKRCPTNGSSKTALSPRKAWEFASPRIGAKGRGGGFNCDSTTPIDLLIEKYTQAMESAALAAEDVAAVTALVAEALPNSFAVQSLMLNRDMLKVAGAAFFAALRSAAAGIPLPEEDAEHVNIHKVRYTSATSQF